MKLFLWVKIFNWVQTETFNSSSTVSVVQWYFENRNISVASENFFDGVKLNIRFSSKSVLFSQVDPSLTAKISNWVQAETPNLCQLLEL